MSEAQMTTTDTHLLPTQPEMDRKICTDDELNALQKAEMQSFIDSLGTWTDMTKTDGYWRLTDQHRLEWEARKK